MLTEFGKMLRKIRIDNEELLRDMATKLNVSPAYVSAVETGKRNVPEEWPDIIIEEYHLSPEEQLTLKELAFNAKNRLKFDLTSMENGDRDLILTFASKFKYLDEKDKRQILSILKKRK